MIKIRILSLLFVLLLLTNLPALADTAPQLVTSKDVSLIDLGHIKVTDFDSFVDFLDVNPQLKQVNMFESRLKAEEIDLLAERYPNILFGWTIRLVEDHYIRTDATAYAINHSNKSKTHKSDNFRQLKYCKNLMALDLGHNGIDDISFMKDLTKLRVIIMANNFITDISPLADLKELEYAELFNNYIDDYSPLANLDRLIDLNLAFNQTEDFTPLYRLKGLKRLWLYNANNRNCKDPVSEECVSSLQSVLPNTLINHTSYSTLGGWRSHQRYYVVFNMLHGEVAWLPWNAEGLVPRYN